MRDSYYKVGFTIIEVMLVLAITGLLIAGVLVGLGSSIGTQRYQDSVSSFQAMLQQQYSDISNTSNSTGVRTCTINGAGKPVLSMAGLVLNKGTSDCVILGKYITTLDNKTLTISKVLGKAVYASNYDDITALTLSNVTVSSTDSETYTLEWGATLRQTNGLVSKFSILILRSPVSGVIKTFINPTAVVSDVTANTLISATYLQRSLVTCVKFDGSINTDKTAIYVVPNSANANGIETVVGGVATGC